jgi:hypothetical protein
VLRISRTTSAAAWNDLGGVDDANLAHIRVAVHGRVEAVRDDHLLRVRGRAEQRYSADGDDRDSGAICVAFIADGDRRR